MKQTQVSDSFVYPTSGEAVLRVETAYSLLRKINAILFHFTPD